MQRNDIKRQAHAASAILCTIAAIALLADPRAAWIAPAILLVASIIIVLTMPNEKPKNEHKDQQDDHCTQQHQPIAIASEKTGELQRQNKAAFVKHHMRLYLYRRIYKSRDAQTFKKTPTKLNRIQVIPSVISRVISGNSSRYKIENTKPQLGVTPKDYWPTNR